MQPVLSYQWQWGSGTLRKRPKKLLGCTGKCCKMLSSLWNDLQSKWKKMNLIFVEPCHIFSLMLGLLFMDVVFSVRGTLKLERWWLSMLVMSFVQFSLISGRCTTTARYAIWCTHSYILVSSTVFSLNSFSTLVNLTKWSVNGILNTSVSPFTYRRSCTVMMYSVLCVLVC